MIRFLADTYSGRYDVLQAGTGDSPLTLPFYESCGFQRSHVVKGFFTKYYDHPIYEGGRQLIDMIYLRKSLTAEKIRNKQIENSSFDMGSVRPEQKGEKDG